MGQGVRKKKKQRELKKISNGGEQREEVGEIQERLLHFPAIFEAVFKLVLSTTNLISALSINQLISAS